MFGGRYSYAMKTFGIHLSVLLLLGSCTVVRCETATDRIQELRAEIARLEAGCVPTNGTVRADVETKFGAGTPATNTKDTPKEGIPADSPYRAYDFCSNGTLFVRYDKRWRVVHAHYIDPYSSKGRILPPTVTPEEELRELEPRLQQMQQIAGEYGKRFGHK
jgi:hypothetical protein